MERKLSACGGDDPVTSLSTASVDPDDRQAYWRDMICDVFVELDCYALDKNFNGAIDNRFVSDIQVSNVSADAQHVVRSDARIARSSMDCFLISIQEQGFGLVSQDGRTAKLSPGAFALYDSTRPYELHFDGAFRQTVLRIPREAFEARFVAPEWFTARALCGSSGVGRVALTCLREITEQVQSASAAAKERLSPTLLDLFALAIADSVDADPEVTTSRMAQLRRIQTYIDDRLRDPNLSLSEIAATHRISTRYLNMLFAGCDTTASRWIWRRRLERSRLDLADPGLRGKTISEIAFSWGFNDVSHYSRTFRNAFGVSPRDFRANLRLTH